MSSVIASIRQGTAASGADTSRLYDSSSTASPLKGSFRIERSTPQGSRHGSLAAPIGDGCSIRLKRTVILFDSMVPLARDQQSAPGQSLFGTGLRYSTQTRYSPGRSKSSFALSCRRHPRYWPG